MFKIVSLSSLASLAFLIGFSMVLNDVLIPHLKPLFNLSYFKASLIQFVFFGAYFIGGFSGKIVSQIGYALGIVLGALLSALGCFLMFFVASIFSYPLMLVALFILSSGMVFLSSASNPFILLISPNNEEHTMLFVQIFFLLGTTLAPLVGTHFIFNPSIHLDKIAEIRKIELPYLYLASAFLILAIVFYSLHKTYFYLISQNIPKNMPLSAKSLLSYKHFILGCLGIFFFMGAETSVGSFLVLTLNDVFHLNKQEASIYLTYFWGSAFFGCIFGASMMRKIAPNICLAINTCLAILILCLILIFQDKSPIELFVSIGMFNSIIFPIISALTLKNLSHLVALGAGFMNIAIIGGAIITPLQGCIIDRLIESHYSLLWAYIVPILCYFYVLFFALKGYKKD
ncbi:MFS transporter [Helicobacter cetorum]|uniref:MFS transporter n=1 Tax=Helicobacter cetorum TaxID=138563 RepID=UPI00131546E8|nr:MFS transporter [Helicobacter cetorum]